MAKPLALSVGCPNGIGPEIAVKAAGIYRHRLKMFGDPEQLEQLARTHRCDLSRHELVESPLPLRSRDRVAGKPSKRSGAAQLEWVRQATQAVARGECRALVTGPVNKHTISRSGAQGAKDFRGHTEFLRDELGAKEVIMAFACPKLVVSLVSTHLPLAKVPAAATPAKVATATYWLAHLLKALRPKLTPSLAVCGLNPHAGEGGLIGTEERTQIGPGIRRARQRLKREELAARILGPVGAETAFRLAKAKGFDGVVAMYHDQATIPLKLVGFGSAVNISLGLPIVRTSVDHGTAYDRAGRGSADPKGLIEALRMGARLSTPTSTDILVSRRPKGSPSSRRR